MTTWIIEVFHQGEEVPTPGQIRDVLCGIPGVSGIQVAKGTLRLAVEAEGLAQAFFSAVVPIAGLAPIEEVSIRLPSVV